MSFGELLALIYPASCLLCGLAGANICPRCEVSLESCRELYEIHNLPLYSALHYNEASSHLILAAKESNDRVAARYLAELMAMRFARLHREVAAENYALVPIPSAKAADRRRGFEHMPLLAKLLAKEIREQYGDICVVTPLLYPARKVVDQSQLTARERAANMKNAFGTKAGIALSSRGIILVDDLVTTGSTMGEALRALRVGRYEPVALLSACVAGRFLANKIGR